MIFVSEDQQAATSHQCVSPVSQVSIIVAVNKAF